MAKLSRATLSGLLLATLFGCAQRNSFTALPSPADDQVAIVVHNSHPQDIKLYLRNGSTRVRVGTAMSMRTTELKLAGVYAKQVGGLELEAEPLGGGPVVAFPAIYVRSNERVVLEVQPAITLSTFAVYKR